MYSVIYRIKGSLEPWIEYRTDIETEQEAEQIKAKLRNEALEIEVVEE